MQAIGEQMAVVSAALKRVYESAFVTSESAFGVYRGTVVDDVDPRQQERVQVLVPEVFAEPTWAPVSRPVGALGVGAQDGRSSSRRADAYSTATMVSASSVGRIRGACGRGRAVLRCGASAAGCGLLSIRWH